ncbi:MAG: glutamate racemase [bacterium]
MNKHKGKIGIFDSGLGGLTILKEVAKLMPCYEYIYLGDNQNTPYGDKSHDEIFNLTLAGVEWLFKNDAEIVILACNTASANALRKIQQEVLPIKYPNRRVLGIIIPTVEEIEKYSRTGHIGILATEATVDSRIYEIEMEKQNPEIKIVSQVGGNLANIIEQNNKNELLAEIKRVTEELLTKDDSIDTVILGCTHYALIANEIIQILPKHIRVISQGKLVAPKLLDYLNRHSEIRNKLSDAFSLNFNTTSNSEHVRQLMTYFYGENISISIVKV